MSPFRVPNSVSLSQLKLSRVFSCPLHSSQRRRLGSIHRAFGRLQAKKSLTFGPTVSPTRTQKSTITMNLPARRRLATRYSQKHTLHARPFDSKGLSSLGFTGLLRKTNTTHDNKTRGGRRTKIHTNRTQTAKQFGVEVVQEEAVTRELTRVNRAALLSNCSKAPASAGLDKRR